MDTKVAYDQEVGLHEEHPIHCSGEQARFYEFFVSRRDVGLMLPPRTHNAIRTRHNEIQGTISTC